MIPVSGPDWLLDVLLSPALWLSIGLAVSCGAAAYGLRGGGLRQLLRDLVAGLIGFGFGHIAGVLMGVDVLQVGQAQVLAGTTGSVLALLLGRLLVRLARSRAGEP